MAAHPSAYAPHSACGAGAQLLVSADFFTSIAAGDMAMSAGRVTALSLTARSFCMHGAKLLTLHPGVAVRLIACSVAVDALAACAGLMKLRTLSLIDNRLGEANVMEIVAGRIFTNIEALDLCGNLLGDDSRAWLAIHFPLASRLNAIRLEVDRKEQSTWP